MELNKTEATPTNTAEKLNPLKFDEAALANILKSRFSEPVEREKVEEQSEEPADAGNASDVDVAASNEDGENGEDQTVDLAQEEEQQEAEDQPEHDGVQKRINKLTAQKKEAIAKAEALERELSEAKAKLDEIGNRPQETQPIASVDNPFADVWEDSKLGDEWRKARELKRWCEDNADGCELNGKEYTSDEIRSIRRRVEDALDVHIPARQQFLAGYRQIKPLAETAYPWWKDRSSTEYSEAQQVLRQMPQIASYPDYQFAIGDFLLGRKVRMEREQSAKSANKAAPKVAPKQPGAPKSAPMRVDKKSAEADQAKTKFLKTGSQAELANLIKSTLLR